MGAKLSFSCKYSPKIKKKINTSKINIVWSQKKNNKNAYCIVEYILFSSKNGLYSCDRFLNYELPSRLEVDSNIVNSLIYVFLRMIF